MAILQIAVPNQKKKMKLQSHQICIINYADDLMLELDQTDCLFDWLGNQLELTTWVTENGLWKAEVLLVYGGPTVTIEMDSRYTFGTLRHSWGDKSQAIEFQHSGLADAIREMRGLE
jgi:hypothetical protein